MSELAWLERAYRRTQHTIGIGRVNTSDDTGNAQMLQVQLGQNEVRDRTPSLGIYGVASNPLPGADAITVSISGDRSNTLVIATGDQRYRLKNLSPGEVALYTDEGDYVRMARGRVIDINTETLNITATTAVNITTPQVTINASTGVAIDTPSLGFSSANPVGVTAPKLAVTGDVLDNSVGTGKTMAAMRAVHDGHTHGGVAAGAAHTAVPDQQE